MISILLPTDFSGNSMNAVKYALEFFKYQKVNFFFMHAYQDEFYNHDKLISREVFDDILEKVKNQSQKNLENLLETAKKMTSNSGFTFQTISAYNTLVDEANLIVDAKNIDLIVMGTKGKSDKRHIIFGSHTLQVLKYVKCPVLAIPSNYTDTQPKRILFPTDYLIPYKHRELKLLCDLAAFYKSIIDVLYISKSDKLSLRQEDNQAFIKETICKTKIDFHIEHGKNIAETIQNYIKTHVIDMLVMVNTQHSFLEDMLFPSNIDIVSVDLKIPLLALQNATRYI